MVRIIIAGVLGAIVCFIWGMLAWMAIPLHGPTIAGLPDENEVTEVLKRQNLETGVYQTPWPNSPADLGDPDSEFMKKHQAGPIFSIYYHKEGSVPMNAGVMLRGFLINLLAATLAACLLSAAAGGCCSTYLRRVGFVMSLGVFVALVGHANFWNWMGFPTDYTIAFIVDVIVAWLLVGLVIAAIVRPSPSDASPVSTDS